MAEVPKKGSENVEPNGLKQAQEGAEDHARTEVFAGRVEAPGSVENLTRQLEATQAEIAKVLKNLSPMIGNLQSVYPSEELAKDLQVAYKQVAQLISPDDQTEAGILKALKQFENAANPESRLT